MPRKPRPDLEPECVIRDLAPIEKEAKKAAAAFDVNIRAYEKAPSSYGSFCFLYEGFYKAIDLILAGKKKLPKGAPDFEFAFRLTGLVDLARFSQLKDMKQPAPAGCIWIKMLAVGSRVTMTHEAIASRLGYSRPFVTEHIQRLKDCGIIVNWGNGWVEFDARLLWRGNTQLRNAYVDVFQWQYQTLHIRSVKHGDEWFLYVCVPCLKKDTHPVHRRKRQKPIRYYLEEGRKKQMPSLRAVHLDPEPKDGTNDE